MTRRSLLALLLTLLAGEAVAQSTWRGPYVNGVTTDEATLVWELPAALPATLRWGALSAGEHVVPVSASRHQSVRLTGLAAVVPAGGEILYEVEVDGVVRAGRFFTAVLPTTPFAFVVYGDNRSSASQHRAVVEAVLREPVPLRFVIDSGDLVSDGQNESLWDDFFDIERPLLAELPLFPVIGNHEVGDDGDWDVYERLFEPPEATPPASGTDAYYRFAHGNVEVIVLDSHVHSLYRFAGFTWPGGQEEWLEEVLDDPLPNVAHRFVVIHVGPYSSKEGRLGNYWLRFWLEDFADAGIDAIISGHDHYMERGYTGNGLLYFIQGGGGAPLYDTLGPRTTPDHTIVYSESRLGYLLVEVDGPLAQFTLKGLDGELLDYAAYGDVAAPECSAAPDCQSQPLPEQACTGAELICRDATCVPTCPDLGSEIVACLTDDDCEDEIGAQCTGTASCDKPDLYNPLTYHCVCSTWECTSNADCAGRPPPIPGCVGTWACMDQVCEFTPQGGICGAQDSAGGEPTPAGDPVVAAEPDAPTDPGGDARARQTQPEHGCSCSVPGSPSAWMLVLLGVMGYRRRSRAGSNPL